MSDSEGALERQAKTCICKQTVHIDERHALPTAWGSSMLPIGFRSPAKRLVRSI